jgi:hypothetical protein
MGDDAVSDAHTRTRVLFTSVLAATAASSAIAQHGGPAYCQIDTHGTEVLIERPAASEAPIDDVNWFARPVPTPDGRWIVGFASHDQNYLYDLTRGRRIRIPDQSDAVATPDGRYITVPSHYTKTQTVNFYDAATLLARLDEGRDAADVRPVFAHDEGDVRDVYYQSVGIVSSRQEGSSTTTVYRLMFSGSNAKPGPGFRIVDYTFTTDGKATKVSPSRAMRLCPEITRDLATPFISKDGRYVVAHDGGSAGQPGTLKIFEIVAVDPAAQTTSCSLRVDFEFAAGKADFSFDGRRITFHISKHDYLVPFVNGGLNAPAITDVVVADLVHDAEGRLVGHGGLARVTSSTREGVGSYFPAFFPDGRVFYIANLVPKNSGEPRRFHLRVVNPNREVTIANFFKDRDRVAAAESIGQLWRDSCAPTLKPFKPGEAAWVVTSLSPAQCEALVATRHRGDAASRQQLAAMCQSLPPRK